MRWLALLVVLGGCDYVLHLETIHPPPDAPPCTPPAIADDFSASSPVCGTWGKAYTMSGTITRQPGELVISPAMITGGDFDGCETSSPFTFGPSGVFVQLAKVPAHSGYGVLELTTLADSTDPGAATTLSFSTGGYSFYDQATCGPSGCTSLAHGAYIPDQMQWAGMIATNAGMALSLEFSPDGITWTSYGSRDLPTVASFAEVTLAGGFASGGSTTDTTIFKNFDICQVP